MIRVLHLTTSFGVGGAEGNLARLVCGMDKARFSNAIVAMNRRLIVSQQVDEQRIPCMSLGMRPGVPNPAGLARLLTIVRQIRPHILQTWMYHADLLGVLAGMLTTVPLIAWNIRCSLIDNPRSWSPQLIRRTLVRWSMIPDAIVANSHAGIRVHQAMGYRPQKWVWIPNSVDLDRFRPYAASGANLRAELGIAPDTAVVGLVARFHAVKDHSNFVSAARLLLASHPNVHYVLAGHGVEPGSSKLAKLIASSGAKERFHLLGLRKDIESVTAGFDVACSSSSAEGSSNTVAEAMACAVPCVVTDVGDSAQIVGDTGKVVPARNSSAFARACGELLELSPHRRKHLGLLARARVAERFSISAVADSYQQLYEHLVALAAARGSRIPKTWERFESDAAG